MRYVCQKFIRNIFLDQTSLACKTLENNDKTNARVCKIQDGVYPKYIDSVFRTHVYTYMYMYMYCSSTYLCIILVMITTVFMYMCVYRTKRRFMIFCKILMYSFWCVFHWNQFRSKQANSELETKFAEKKTQVDVTNVKALSALYI